jgi:8-oxo-dGTP diphosphatase
MDDLFHSSVKGVVIRDGKILLVQYDEEGVGIHYNLPGGRQRKDETLHEALRRKMMEEAGADVDVGPFLFVYEFIGKNHDYFDGPKHSVSLVFKCTLRAGSEPSITTCTKPEIGKQTDVEWVPLERFGAIVFWPGVPDKIVTLYNRTERADDRYLGDIL